jgi:hypothetical protein
MEMWVPGNPNDRSVLGFRIRHGGSRGPMSVTLYNKLKKSGRGPRETVVGGAIVILCEHEREWDEARANPSDTELKLIEQTRERWHRRAKKAGAASAKSPKHISRLRLGRRKRPRAK